MALSAAHAKKVYAKATSTAPIASDEIKGVTDASDPWNRDKVDTTSYSDDIYKTAMTTLIDVTLNLSGFEDMTDAPQGLLRSYLISGATLYVTILGDGTNGFTYPCLVTAYERSGAVGEGNSFSCTLALNGAPIARP
jgi:hypothetical protein